MTKSKERPSVMLEQLGAHCDYLEQTLIPDLKETMPETARDIEVILPYLKAWLGRDTRPREFVPSRYR
jgi:hypothetical protein